MDSRPQLEIGLIECYIMEIVLSFNGFLIEPCQCFCNSAKILQDFVFGGVPELADGLDLGSSAAMRGGSNPPSPIKKLGSGTAVIKLGQN